jgi:type 2 lantibiotic biosynthesis protein LanM
MIQEWKNITHKFDDEDVWQSRKNLNGCTTDCDFKHYLLKLKRRKIDNSKFSFLIDILNSATNLDIHFDFTDSDEVFLCPFRRIAIFLTNKTLSTLHNYAYIENYKLKENLLVQYQSKIFEILNLSIQYEYHIYLKAYLLSDDSANKVHFYNKVSNTIEWSNYYLESYPVLISILYNFIHQSISNIETSIMRLREDWAEINCFFLFSDAFYLSNVKLFAGDFHNNNQSPILFEFTGKDNSHQLLYYKPKSLIGDIFVNDCVSFLWSLGLKQSLTQTKNINKSDYGWQLHIDYQPVNKIEDVSCFFYSQGINCALAYIFNIQDLIADNILVHNNLPVFFDLEMVFEPTFKEGCDYKSSSLEAKKYICGVIKTGLIPEYGFETINNKGFSNSGISRVSGNTYYHVKREKNNEKLVIKDVIAADYNLPQYNGQVFPIDEFCSDFENGFIYACYFLIQKKNDIIDFLSEKFKIINLIKSRVLIRFTYTYSSLLKESYSPLYLSNFLKYEKFMEMLWRGYDKVLLPPNVIQSEIDQIKNGDIPYFYTFSNSKELFSGNNEIIQYDYFDKSGFDTVLDRLKEIDQELIFEQLNIIRRAFYIHNNHNAKLFHRHHASTINKKENIIDNIINFLCNLSPKTDDNHFAYIDYIVSHNDMWSQGVQNSDIFQGIDGVGLSLLAGYKLNKNPELLNIVNKINKQSIDFYKNNYNTFLDIDRPKIGIVHSPISTLFFIIQANKILGYNHFAIEKHTLNLFLNYIEVKYKNDIYYSYFSGVTGTLFVLLELYKLFSEQRIFDLIIKTSEHLVNGSTSIKGDRIFWNQPVFDKWGGVAHGTSFISYVLFRVANITKNQFYYDAAIKALQYDQSLFDKNLKVWKKTEHFLGEIHHSWGNGSAGIGLSRKLISTYYSNAFMQDEINISIENIDKTIPIAFAKDHSICSGLLGLLEIRKFLDASYDYSSILNQYFNTYITVESVKCGGWEGNPLVTGLYYGVAGINYNLIKLVYPDKNIPSLLWQ